MLSYRVLAAVLTAAALPAAPSWAQSGDFPNRPLRMIVPFSPGGPNDILGRLVGQKLTELWGQPVLVENRGGAGGTVGISAASKLPGDGYHLAMGGSSNLAVAPSLYKKLAYDPVKDFAPIALVAHVPYGLGLNPVVPAKTVRDLVAMAKRQPDYLNYASSGVGSMSALCAELFKSLSGTKIVHVPYKGTAPALTEVVGGQVDMMFADLALILRHVNTGKMKVIAVTGSRRAPAARQVPTIDESGLKGYVIEPWFAVVAPAGVPADIAAKLNAAIVAGLKAPDVAQRLDALGYEPIGGTVADFVKTLKDDTEKYAGIVKRAGISGAL